MCLCVGTVHDGERGGPCVSCWRTGSYAGRLGTS